MASAVSDVAAARRDYLDESGGRYVHVIADGGMRTGGDVAKAIACGADAVMIARGDLSLEIPFERVPVEQKRIVLAAREALGPDIELMIDAHGTCSLPEAKRLMRLVEGANLRWFEEPTPLDDHAAAAELRATTDVPIAVGESLSTRFDFADVLRLRAADVLQPDVALVGGIIMGAAARVTRGCTSGQALSGGALMSVAALAGGFFTFLLALAVTEAARAGAVLVGEDLDFDVARVLEEFFHVHGRVAEGGERLGHCQIDLRFELRRVVHALHAAATATSSCFDDHRIAYTQGRSFKKGRVIGQRAV